MSNRKEFIMLALSENANITKICKRFNISRKTAYKWLQRYKQKGEEGLFEQSKRPHSSPNKTDKKTERKILEIRSKHPAWGARKLRKYLELRNVINLPTPSTITNILYRHGCIEEKESERRQHYVRFEHEQPNDLWQMDFKGHFPLEKQRCHPLTILDDHSRFSIGLCACDNERFETVKNCLIKTFALYGLPKRMTMDNGSPWGNVYEDGLTELTVWLIRMGINVSHSRPGHPQTQGKDGTPGEAWLS